MNIFYYTAAATECSGGCHYQTCSKRFSAYLEELPQRSKLKILPQGTILNSPSAMELRSGDIAILYAGEQKDMDFLIAQRDFFEEFRVVLIVGDNSLLHVGSHYSLNPRFTMVLTPELEHLGDVLDRMTEGSHTMKTHHSFQQGENYHE